MKRISEKKTNKTSREAKVYMLTLVPKLKTKKLLKRIKKAFMKAVYL